MAEWCPGGSYDAWKTDVDGAMTEPQEPDMKKVYCEGGTPGHGCRRLALRIEQGVPLCEQCLTAQEQRARRQGAA